MTINELIQEFIFDCEVRELSARTTHNYQKQLKQFEAFLDGSCGVKRLEDLKSVDIKQFVSMLQKRGCKPKPSYTNDMLKAVKVLCGYAYREGYTEELITKRVRNPQAVYKWQHGECLPSVDNLFALARLLRVGMDDLLVACGSDEEVPQFTGKSKSKQTFDPNRSGDLLASAFVCYILFCPERCV